ncbi:hypothetical protein HOY80DRAFT_1002226 [Tuber brumale]|nr:hypothetical protein HOY80DRAFT_1002226 [Tuber brumale]
MSRSTYRVAGEQPPHDSRYVAQPPSTHPPAFHAPAPGEPPGFTRSQSDRSASYIIHHRHSFPTDIYIQQSASETTYPGTPETPGTSPPKPQISRTLVAILLVTSTSLVALCAEFLVSSIGHLVSNTPIGEALIGLIILFITPIVVTIGWILDKPMSLHFNPLGDQGSFLQRVRGRLRGFASGGYGRAGSIFLARAGWKWSFPTSMLWVYKLSKGIHKRNIHPVSSYKQKV